MRKVYCDRLIERLVNYMMSVWMYDYQRADRKIVKKEIKEIMEEFENGKEKDSVHGTMATEHK